VSRLVRGVELIGMPIVSLESASTLGEIKDVLVDPSRSSIIGFTVRGHGLLSSPLIGILAGENVYAIGRDALMITSEAALVREREGMSGAMADQQEVVGKEVVTSGGSSLGTVNDVIVEIEGSSANVVGYEISRDDGRTVIVPAPSGVPLSGDALLLPDEVEQEAAANGLAGFRDVLNRARMVHAADA
jgi:uncharacterized protein YrrD